jgi:hypothetical protein
MAEPIVFISHIRFKAGAFDMYREPHHIAGYLRSATG